MPAPAPEPPQTVLVTRDGTQWLAVLADTPAPVCQAYGDTVPAALRALAAALEGRG